MKLEVDGKDLVSQGSSGHVVAVSSVHAVPLSLSTEKVEAPGGAQYRTREDASIMEELLHAEWLKHEEGHANLPVARTDAVPYSLPLQRKLIVEGFEAAGTHGSDPKNDLLPCLVPNCNTLVKRDFMRGHVARHKVLGDTPKEACGCCGSATSGCKVMMKDPPRKHANTNTGFPQPRDGDNFCKNKYFSLFKYGPAFKGTKRNPSTDVPVLCMKCSPPRWVWRYAVKNHVSECHPEWENQDEAEGVQSESHWRLTNRTKETLSHISDEEKHAVKACVNYQ